jgi:hypothetical protein
MPTQLNEVDLLERISELENFHEFLLSDEKNNEKRLLNNQNTINYYTKLLKQFQPQIKEKREMNLQQLRNIAQEKYLKENIMTSEVIDEKKKSSSLSSLKSIKSINNMSNYLKKQYYSFQSNDNEIIIQSPKKKDDSILVVNDEFFEKEEEKKSKKYEIISKKQGVLKLNTNPFSSLTNEKKKISSLKVVTCTWNVGEGYSVSIAPWILSIGGVDADIYAIGFQEVDMSLYSIVNNHSKALKSWDEHFSYHFNPGSYKKVISQQLVGMYHVLYIKNEHFNSLSNFE